MAATWSADGWPAGGAAFCKAELDRAAQDFAGFRSTYPNPTQVPRSADGNDVRLVATSDWTSGFVAGSYWYLYEHTADQAFRSAAEAFTTALASQAARTDTHDVGFVINNSYGNGLRLTDNAAYPDVIIEAAESLRSRFNQNVGATRSWDFGSWQFPVIIDNMMNLELLFRAAELAGDAELYDVAITHALTTRTHHFRDDMSSFHVVDYDPSTGAVISRETEQGVRDQSAWARGQSWGLYGFTMAYRETEDARFLETALGIADFYTSNANMPEDGVPYFDFDAPLLDDVPEYRDVSAAAIAASALLELAGYAPAVDRERYLGFAIKVLRSLSSEEYRADPATHGRFLLMHAVGNYPDNDEIDVSINYADYYYLEALLRCARLA